MKKIILILIMLVMVVGVGFTYTYNEEKDYYELEFDDNFNEVFSMAENEFFLWFKREIEGPDLCREEINEIFLTVFKYDLKDLIVWSLENDSLLKKSILIYDKEMNLVAVDRMPRQAVILEKIHYEVIKLLYFDYYCKNNDLEDHYEDYFKIYNHNILSWLYY